MNQAGILEMNMDMAMAMALCCRRAMVRIWMGEEDGSIEHKTNSRRVQPEAAGAKMRDRRPVMSSDGEVVGEEKGEACCWDYRSNRGGCGEGGEHVVENTNSDREE
jgi:hypothetical protein